MKPVTDRRQRFNERDILIYKEFKSLVKTGMNKKEATDELAEKYYVNSVSIWRARVNGKKQLRKCQRNKNFTTEKLENV